jgi:hypothetical protein
MNKKPIIIWDFDDVLFPLTENWFNQVGAGMQSRITRYEEVTVNPPLELMGLSLDDYLGSLDSFRLSDFAQTIKPKKVIQNWFAVYGSAYENEVLTARPLHTLEAAKTWLANYFPNYFSGFGFVPSARPGVDISGYPKSKRAFLEAENMRPQYFIDDKAETVADISAMGGIHAILYPAPWNAARSLSSDPNILINGAAHDQAL